MEKFNWKLTIKTNIFMLKIFGIWPAGNNTYKLNLYTLYAAVSILIFLCGHNFFQTFNIIFILDDLQALTATIVVSLTELIGIFKTYYLIRNMKILKNLMVALNSDMFQPKNLRQRNLVQTTLNLWKTVYTVFSFMAFLACVFCSIFPILDDSRKDYRLPFLAWYPYDTKVSPFYEMTYLYQVTSVFFICFINLNIDTLIAALNMYIGAQCDILCDNLRHIHDFSCINYCGLMYCVRHHRAILKFAEASNKFSNWIILIQFFTSVVSIGMTLFQLTEVAAFSSEFYFYIFYGNAVVVEIFMYCWYGNEVEMKSSNISYAAFESEWTKASVEVQNELLFFILRCRTPIKVSALKLFNLSLDTFMKILRTSWSYFAVLHQISDKS